MIDLLLARLAVAAIRLYQWIGRPWFRRVCLFRPTCSHRGIALLRQHGFRSGLPLVRQQVRECNENYSLRLNGAGEVELVTSAGRVVPEREVNPRIAAKVRPWFPVHVLARQLHPGAADAPR
jgi:putative component of membrane protein insertase Oxa1/YidC/SpoIIIJ protein YidD